MNGDHPGPGEGRHVGDPHGHLRVYGRKKGHVTAAEQAWLACSQPTALPPKAGNREELVRALGGVPGSCRLVMEFGFGNGQALTALARSHPGDRFIGVEIFQEGMVALLKRLVAEGIGNVRMVEGHGLEVLSRWIPEASLDRAIISFPDPWPKKRHHKRRLVQVDFLEVLASRMVSGGVLELATDWEEYAQWMVACLEATPTFVNQNPEGIFSSAPADWVMTRFEQKGREAGRRIRHLAYFRR
ncbi:MAG: tRNA (guanosine(46)-N7)-methyltransferase TrmB [Magnetococcales bacterium]|nr:tRNA (guanosine(46)-N7)-methyltransferase TrmB [Magnetococcales bacterium]